MQNYTQPYEDEIMFWRNMINEWRLDRDLPEFRRMQDALALAEFKRSEFCVIKSQQ